MIIRTRAFYPRFAPQKIIIVINRKISISFLHQSNKSDTLRSHVLLKINSNCILKCHIYVTLCDNIVTLSLVFTSSFMIFKTDCWFSHLAQTNYLTKLKALIFMISFLDSSLRRKMKNVIFLIFITFTIFFFSRIIGFWQLRQRLKKYGETIGYACQ